MTLTEPLPAKLNLRIAPSILSVSLCQVGVIEVIFLYYANACDLALSGGLYEYLYCISSTKVDFLLLCIHKGSKIVMSFVSVFFFELFVLGTFVIS